MRRRKSRLVVLTLMAALVGAAVVAGVIGAVGGTPAVRTATTTTTALPTTTLVPASPLGPAGTQLDRLLAAGRKARYHAVYTVEDPELEGIEQSLEVWRDGDRLRSDIVEKGWADGTHRSTNIDDGRTKRTCATRAGKQSCQIVETLPLDLPAVFVQALVDAEPKATITTSNDDVAGYQAKCFAAADVGELCVTTDGVMLRLVFRKATVTATIVEDAVPESAFDVSG